MRYVEKNLSMLLIVLLGLVMIAFAIWFFERRIAKIERRMKPAVGYLQTAKRVTLSREVFSVKVISPIKSK